MKNLPRIIGTALLLITLFAWLGQARGWLGVGLAGIILLVAPTKHAQRMLDLFVDSLLKWKLLLTTALYDAAYWALLYGSLQAYILTLKNKLAGMAIPTTGMLLQGAAPETAANLKGILTAMLAGLALLTLLAYALYTVSRGLIWLRIAGQKPSKSFFKTFFALNGIWWAIWTALFIFINLGITDQPQLATSMTLLLVIASYFTVIIHSLFTKTKKLTALSEGVAHGIAKIHTLIVPLLGYALTIYVIAYQLFRLFPPSLIQPLSIIFVILFMSWLRIYLYKATTTKV